MIALLTPEDSLSTIAQLMRERRVSLDMTQAQLSRQANVSLAVLRKFEQTGKISLESFIKLAFVLELTEPLQEALNPVTEHISSLDDLFKEGKKPKRKYAYSPRKKKSKKNA